MAYLAATRLVSRLSWDERGILLVFDHLVYPEEISIEMVGEGNFDIVLSRDGKDPLWLSYSLTPQDEGMLKVGDLPDSIKKKGIDKIFIFPYDKKPPYYLVKLSTK